MQTQKGKTLMDKIKGILTDKLSRELIVYLIAGVLTTVVDWAVTFILDIWLLPTLTLE